MNSEKFFTWCRIAVKKIKYRPDRDAVHKELYEHLEDRYESFRSRGWEHEEAIDKTVEAMGSAEELAPQLAKIHRPFWPYVLIISRVILIIAIALTVIPFGLFLYENYFFNYSFDSPFLGDVFDPYIDDEYKDTHEQSKRITYLEPGCSVSTDGYWLTVTRAARWRSKYVGGQNFERFYIRLRVMNLRPWAEPADAVMTFWAEDSLGNRYYNTIEYADSNEPQIPVSANRTGLFTYTYDLCLYKYVSQDAQWIDLRYEREGRELTLRIDLTGGEAS